MMIAYTHARFLLLRKGGKSEQFIHKIEKDGQLPADPRRIRCPKCAWQPKSSSRWVCAYCHVPENYLGGCGTAWNTFETGGICPGCKHRWRWTSCLSCGRWSLHMDWYEGE